MALSASLVVRLVAFAMLALVAAMPGAVHAESRLALVIGNAAYSFGPLGNPRNDAERMAATLKDAGFNVITLVDADQELMKDRKSVV